MGIIQRQGFKYTIIGYIGVALGFISTFFIYTKEFELYGLIQVLMASSALIMAIFSFGLSIISVKFFPEFEDPKKGHHGFLGFLLLGSLLGFLVFLLLLFPIRTFLLDYLYVKDDSRELFAQFFYYLVPLVFLYIYNMTFTRYISNFHRIVVPGILNDLLLKISLPILVLSFAAGYLSMKGVVIGLVLHFVLVLLGLVIYTRQLGQIFVRPNWEFITRPLAKRMGEFSMFGVMNALGSQLANRIDVLMVSMLVSFEQSGIYVICNFMAEVVFKPARGIMNIASPLISQHWKTEDLEEIKIVYQKSSLNLMIIGLLAFLGIWLSLDDLFSLIPNGDKLANGKYVFFFLGLAKLADMATSVNTDIIGYSKHFRFNFYVLLILAVLNVLFNYTFIPMYLITGAAIATFCSVGLFNLAKVSFIWWKFGLQPFTLQTIVVLAIATATYLIFNYLPLTQNALLDIPIRSALIGLFYLALIYYLKPSPDMNGMIEKFLGRFI